MGEMVQIMEETIGIQKLRHGYFPWVETKVNPADEEGTLIF
jgi:hypothetical protein